MTSQHFDDGWDNWGDGGGWDANFSEGNNNNNIRTQSSQVANQQPYNPQQQQQQQPTVNAPIYSPFAYSQPTAAPVPVQQMPPSIANSANLSNPPTHQQINQQQQQQQQYGNPVNFFNPSHFSSDSVNNNPMSPFNTVQSPIQTSASIIQQQQQHQQPIATPPMYNMQSHEITPKIATPQNIQYPTPSAQPMQNIQQQQQGYQQSEKASFTPPPPLMTTTTASSSSSFYDPNQHQQQLQDSKNMNYQQQQPPFYQPQHSAAPATSTIPSMSSSTINQNPQEQQHFSQWNDLQQTQNLNYQNWNMMNQNVYSQPQQQQPPVSSNSSNDWERISPDSIQFLQQQAAAAQQGEFQGPQTSGKMIMVESPAQQGARKSIEEPPKVENVENNQVPETVSYSAPHAPTTIFQPSVTDSTMYPENRERLDEVAPPLRPPSSSSSIDRNNFLITGQLSNDIQQFNQNSSVQEVLPPPGLSRMVVGEPESNQEQLPSGSRMVTGTEMTPASFMNYQRQADGEVSQSPTMPVRPPSHPPSFAHNIIEESQQNQLQQQQHQPLQNFNVGDRNLYLVAGESDMNSQRVIPGVESDNSLNNINNNNNNNSNTNNINNVIINPLQNLHIEDDDDFVNISVSSQHRNVDGDGMEEQQQQRLGIMVNTGEQREEDIEGANDNNAENAAISIIHHEPAELDIREDIEGANDEIPAPAKPTNDNLDSTARKSFDKKLKPESSEDSELREVERNSKIKPRRSKKYDSNESESEIDDEYKDIKKRDKYIDDRYKRSSNRDRMSREEYEKYRRREKERRSGGGGSRHGDSRRRTDDEDEERRRRDKYKGRSRAGDDEEEPIDDKKKDKRKEGTRKKDYEEDDVDRERRERRRRDRYYSKYPEGGRRSQNTSDREYDHRYNSRSSRGGAYDAPGYYQGYGGYDHNYNYNSTIYYQQQQYLESLRRTNPQAYEWYKNYYGMMQQQQAQLQQQQQAPAMDDIGGSLHSGYNSSSEKGRSSTTRFLPGGNVSNPQIRSLNTSFIDSTDYQSLQASSSFQPIGKDFNQPYASLNFNQGYGYNQYGDLRAKQEPAVVPGRMTPKKFLCAHDYVSLSNGQMTTVDASDNRFLVKLENVPIYDRNRRLYQSYPGPLVRGVSHKKTIIEFCEDKLKHNSHIEYGLRASHALLWSYLILMLRQNGTYTEADISELLMKNFDDFKSSLQETVNEEEEAVEEEEVAADDTDVSGSEENATSERNSNTVSQATPSQTQSGLTENVVLDKFKNYLLYGNIGDALDFATDNNLWGHALFLASKVDRRQHANVMLKFANKLPYNDPLQTLYQIMSGRMPACVTNLDDKWGDWRPHLAMIISNCTDKPDLVKRSVIALGDSLAGRGDTFGSQFCYLLMDPQFTDFSDSQMVNGKIGLLGVSLQQRTIKEFATDDAIIMTEVYEYARSLSVENYFIASLQKYKVILAANMLDYGMQLKCLLYMEHISKCIVQQPDLFDVAFMTKIYDLGDRLKFYDPVLERAYEEGNESAEDQKWLQDLFAVMASKSGEFVQQQQSTPQIPTYSTNEVYNPVVDYQQQQRSSVSSGGIYDPMSNSQQQTPTHVPQQQLPPSVYDSTDQPYQNDQQMYQNDQQIYQQYQQQQQQVQQPDFGNTYYQNDLMRRESVPQVNEQQNYLQPPSTAAANTNTSYDPNAQMNNSYQPDYSYSSGYDQSFQQPQPTITMGNSISKKFDEGNEGNSEQKNHESPLKKQQESDKSNKKATPQQDAGSGWFGGIFSKLKSKSSQMKLPDDKNPSIVWDETNKRWINKDEDATETEAFKPPPKMGEMMMGNNPPMVQQQQQQQPPQQIAPQPSIPQMQQQQNQFAQQSASPTMQGNPYGTQNQPQQQQQLQQPAINSMPMNNQTSQPNANAPAAEQPAPPSAPNMFKMQKGRNLKKSYVDIFEKSGKTIPATSKDVAPPQMDMQFFNPQAQQSQGMQFYNPNDFQQ